MSAPLDTLSRLIRAADAAPAIADCLRIEDAATKSARNFNDNVPRMADILARRFSETERETLRQVAERWGVTVERVRQIEGKGLRILRFRWARGGRRDAIAALPPRLVRALGIPS